MRFFGFLRGGIVAAAFSAITALAGAESFVSCQFPSHSTSLQTAEHISRLPIITPTRARRALPASTLQRAFQEVSDAFEAQGLSAAQSFTTLESDAATAFVRNSHEVVLTTGLISTMLDTGQIKYVLAHEMAHIALHHPRDSLPGAELEADALAISVLERTGADPCAAQTTLRMLKVKEVLYWRELDLRLTALHRALGARCNNTPPMSLAYLSAPSEKH